MKLNRVEKIAEKAYNDGRISFLALSCICFCIDELPADATTENAIRFLDLEANVNAMFYGTSAEIESDDDEEEIERKIAAQDAIKDEVLEFFGSAE